MNRPVCNEDGFSLIEVLMAVAILSVAIMALLGTFFSGQRNVTQAERLTIATDLAMEGIEKAKEYKYSVLEDTPSPMAGGDNLEDYGEVPGYPDFKRVWIIEENTPPLGTCNHDPSGPDNGPCIMTVRCAVLWKRPGGLESTTTGELFDPTTPNNPRAIAELRTLIKSR